MASELSLSEDEITAGVAYSTVNYLGEDWDTLSDEDKEVYYKMADDMFG